MNLNVIKDILKAETITANCNMDIQIDKIFSADLMSDVLAFCKAGSLLITALTNPQVIRTAEFANIKAIIFVNGKRPDKEAIALSEDKKIPLIITNLSKFDTCGRLYKEGLRGYPDVE